MGFFHWGVAAFGHYSTRLDPMDGDRWTDLIPLFWREYMICSLVTWIGLKWNGMGRVSGILKTNACMHGRDVM